MTCPHEVIPGLTVNITVAVPAVVTTPTTGGTGYSAGVISNVTSGGAGTGIEGTVTVVGGAVTTFTIPDGEPGQTLVIQTIDANDIASLLDERWHPY